MRGRWLQAPSGNSFLSLPCHTEAAGFRDLDQKTDLDFLTPLQAKYLLEPNFQKALSFFFFGGGRAKSHYVALAGLELSCFVDQVGLEIA